MARKMTAADVENEARVSEQSQAVLALIADGHRTNLLRYVDQRTGEELRWLVLALGRYALQQESRLERAEGELETVRAENTRLDIANAELFRVRQDLTKRLEQHRRFLDHRAATSPAGQATR